MRIRMIADRTGPRWDGRDWPPYGGEIDVPDDEGAALCEHGYAVPVVTDGVGVPEQPDPAVETRDAVPLEATVGGRLLGAEADDRGLTVTIAPPPSAADEAAPPKPIVNAPKAAWVDFAVTRGFDRGVAESMTKADLIARFGRDQGAPEG